MKLQNILTADCTLCSVSLSSKKRILEKIASVASTKIPELDHHQLLSSLLEREKMGSTGIGNGIAIPHGRLTDTNDVVAVFLTSKSPIAFDAIDNRDVDIFIALFVPENCCDEHLSTLQSIAQLFSDKNTCKQVRKCNDDQKLFDYIKQLG
jgi:PTS system nitrogen regulatory IIA component